MLKRKEKSKTRSSRSRVEAKIVKCTQERKEQKSKSILERAQKYLNPKLRLMIH